MPKPHLKDGATIRFESTRENTFAKKVEQIPVTKQLTDKIILGNLLEDLKASPGFLALDKWITENYDFLKLINLMETAPEEHKKMCYKRLAYEEMYAWINLKIIERNKAREILEQEEKAKEEIK